MKRYSLLTATLFAGSLLTAQAGPKEEVTAAIKKLKDKGNYSWTSTSKRPERPAGEDGRRRGGNSTSKGKTADGFVLSVRSFGDRTFESLRKGERSASKREGEWTVREPRGEGRGEGRRGGRRGSRGSSLPAERAADLLAKVGELKKDGEVYSGDLTAEGAKELLSLGRGRRGGDNENAQRPEPKGLKASAKFWVKDGVLVKYETVTAGSIKFRENDFDLSRTSTVEISDVGSTKIEAPEDVKKKLSAPAKPKEAAPTVG